FPVGFVVDVVELAFQLAVGVVVFPWAGLFPGRIYAFQLEDAGVIVFFVGPVDLSVFVGGDGLDVAVAVPRFYGAVEHAGGIGLEHRGISVVGEGQLYSFHFTCVVVGDSVWGARQEVGD